ncbi:very short patch repair endonuclease [Prosthecobacter sp.]|uniref:very short patch repair endonuclease n=1 Tax=Prosthecobacter sp. TaxID=1965333 RepID=UPI002ABC07A6|nr:very short patch repair endonuclease [Prosthecobacter sp.]MDZ4403015.1 very short patch repair endonuclease [Prosthecobacter sp.]
MPDVFTKAKRSEVMSCIRSHGNAATELRLVKWMREAGITGWRRQLSLSVKASKIKRFKVRPDFVFRRERVAVFVDGCFWHACPRHATRPKQNRKFWDAKIERNQKRDLLVTRELRKAGWTVLRLWECALTKKRQASTLARLRRVLGKQ